MTLMKAEVKAAAVHDVGIKLEDKLEAAKSEMSEAKGIRAGFDFAVRRMEQMTTTLDAEVKAEPPKLSEDEYKIAKKYLAKVTDALKGLVQGATETFLRAQGKVIALDQVVKTLSDLHKAEEGKVEALKSGAMVEEDSGKLPGGAPGDATVLPLHRTPGTYPGNPLAALRARDAAPPTPPEPPKKRGRKKKET
jgi:hypothetical protein